MGECILAVRMHSTRVTRFGQGQNALYGNTLTTWHPTATPHMTGVSAMLAKAAQQYENHCRLSSM